LKTKPQFFLFFLCFVFVFSNAKAQHGTLLDNSGPDEVFNRILTPEVIIARKMQRITVKMVIKRDGRRLQETGRKRVYHFSKEGQLSWIYEIPFEGSTDSTLIFFYRNQDSTFMVKRKTEQGRFNSTYLKLDSLQRPLKIIHCIETSENESYRDFKPANQQVLSKEQIRYTYNGPGQLRKKYLNDDGVVYKEGILYSTLHKPDKEEISFVATGTRVVHSYNYDAKGNLSAYNYFTDAMGAYTETLQFTYENNRLSGQKFLKNNLPQEERFFFYNNISGLPESMLVRKTSQYDLVFYNFTYEFY
jgi:hypothetical protein